MTGIQILNVTQMYTTHDLWLQISVYLMPFLGIAELIKLNNTIKKREKHQESHVGDKNSERYTDVHYP